jgi:uncharacterized membrane protein YcfT
MRDAANAGKGRVDWVDYSKGICIIMVVMMHSTLGVEAAAGREGFMHAVVAFARPFRMPDFFLISGLFLAQVIDRDWRTYLDRKVLHFAYFYVLWCTVQFAFKAPGMMGALGAQGVALEYAKAFIEPFGTLWFIYLLPIFFVVTRLARVASIPPWLVWLVGAALEMAPISTGWTVIDEFAARFVYFYTGYWIAAYVFALSRAAGEKPMRAFTGLAAWAAADALLVYFDLATLPGVSLILGYAGAMAVITTAVLLTKAAACDPVRYCGQNSIVIYLAFFLPMALSRTLLLKFAGTLDIGLISLIVTATGVIGALVMWWALRKTPLSFLYTRPDALRLEPRGRMVLQAAE